MPSFNAGHNTGYALAVLVDGAKLFRYRSRLRSLLGLPEMEGTGLASTAPRPPMGFRYQNEPGFDGSWPGPQATGVPYRPDLSSPPGTGFTGRQDPEGQPPDRTRSGIADISGDRFDADPGVDWGLGAENLKEQTFRAPQLAGSVGPDLAVCRQGNLTTGPAAREGVFDVAAGSFSFGNQAGLQGIPTAKSAESAVSGNPPTTAPGRVNGSDPVRPADSKTLQAQGMSADERSSDRQISSGTSQSARTILPVKVQKPLQPQACSRIRPQPKAADRASSREPASPAGFDLTTGANVTLGVPAPAEPAVAGREVAAMASDTGSPSGMRSARFQTAVSTAGGGQTGIPHPAREQAAEESDRPVSGASAPLPGIRRQRRPGAAAEPSPFAGGTSARAEGPPGSGKPQGVSNGAASPDAGDASWSQPEVLQSTAAIPGYTLKRSEPLSHSSETHDMLSGERNEAPVAGIFAKPHGTMVAAQDGPASVRRSGTMNEPVPGPMDPAGGSTRPTSDNRSRSFLEGGTDAADAEAPSAWSRIPTAKRDPGRLPGALEKTGLTAAPRPEPVAPLDELPAAGRPANATAGAAVDHLRQAVHQLAGKLSGRKTASEPQPRSTTGVPPAPPPRIVVIPRSSPRTRRSSVFWERHHLGRSGLRILR